MPLIAGLASIGLVKDLNGWKLPPEAWTIALNVRLENGNVTRIGGDEQVFGTPSAAPYFVMQTRDNDGRKWIYASLTGIFGYDGSSHADLSGTSAPYAAASAADWAGTLLAGVPILTDGSKVPQYWPTQTLATDFADLPNWPANTSCKIIRAFGPFLIALNITKAAGSYPHMVKWSHPADPGSVPASWDETDPTKDAGEFELGDADAGVIVDGLSLRGVFYIYKEHATWAMRYIGGNSIWDIKPFMETTGLLGPRCVGQVGNGRWHFFASADNIFIHDGNTPTPLLDNRMRQTVYSAINNDNKNACFVFANPAKNEMGFAYPESGESIPSRCLLWNYQEGKTSLGAFTEREWSFVAAALVDVEAAGLTWDAETSQAWNADEAIWAESARRQVIVADPTNTKLKLIDNGTTFDGTPFTSILQREGLLVIGSDRNGAPRSDARRRKLVTRIWPLVEGEGRIRMGRQDIIDGSVSWEAYQAFNGDTQKYLDFVLEGAAWAVEFENFSAVIAYDVEVVPTGMDF